MKVEIRAGAWPFCSSQYGLLTCGFLVVQLAIGGCGDNCDERHPIGSSPLTITVVDADTGDTICDAEVTVEYEGVTTELQAQCRSVAGTGTGSYQISARRSGYAEKVTDVSVSLDECSDIVTEHVTLELTPASQLAARRHARAARLF